MTSLERVALQYLRLDSLEDMKCIPRKELESRLDEATPSILERLSASEILQHSRDVYTETADEYAANPHTQYVVDELIEFMALLPEGACVLDVGCGTGRDALFMSCPNTLFRASLMQREKNGKKTIEKFSPPQTSLRIIALDGSDGMLEKALEYLALHEDLVFAYTPLFILGDMHDLHAQAEILGVGSLEGIWSCTALFTHTPQKLANESLRAVAEFLKSGGVFFASYTNGNVAGAHDKLLASSTGRIKYFSQPNPEVVADLARHHGLHLIQESVSDFEIGGKVVQRGLFCSQFFRKQ
ncbi:MAG: class I SAM-dependent methyltransferase [bacterium]|nr:class I SAM-dependent methyltransferase [bacterium]